MGARRHGLITGSLIAISLSAQPAAQAQEGGRIATANFEQRFEFDDNPESRVDTSDPTFLSRTRLSFGYASVTETQALALDLGGELRYVLSTDADYPIREGLQNPFARLSFGQQGKTSRFDLEAAYSKSDVGDLRFVETPDGEDIIVGEGSVERNSLRLDYETGIDGPLGFQFGLDYSQRVYSDTTDPDLNDNETLAVDATLRAQLNPKIDGRLFALYERENEFDAGQTDRDTTRAGIGLDFRPIEGRAISFDLSGDLIETREEGGAVEREEGYSARLAFSQDVRDGDFTVEAGRIIESVGPRTFFAFERSIERPSNRFSLRLGATNNDNVGTSPLATLRWERDVASGQLALTYTDNTRVTIDDEEFRDRALRFSLERELTSTSSVTLLLGAADVESLDGLGNDQTRREFALTYRRAVTRDWDFVGGYDYSDSKTNGTDQITRNRLFFALSRDFAARP